MGSNVQPAAILIGLLTVVTRPLFAQQVSIDVIALEDDMIPGTTDVYQQFGTPSVNSRGDVVFEAHHTPAHFKSCLMYFDSESQQLARIINEDDPAPAGRGEFWELGPEAFALLDDGTVAFTATLFNTTPPTIDSGVFRVHPDSGIPVEIAFEGDPVSAGVFLGRFDSVPQRQLSSNAHGDVAFFSNLSAPQSSTYGLYRASSDSLTEIMRSGEFGPSIGKIVNTFSLPDLNDRGEVAFVGINGTGSSSGDTEAVYRGSGAGLATIATKHDVLFPEITLGGFGNPAINNRGEVACRVYMETPDASNWGMITGSGGIAVPVWVPGEPAPGGDTKGVLWSDPALNNRGQIAFDASVYPNQRGLFFWNGFEVEVIAREDDPAPGGGTFREQYSSTSINDDGQVLFIASVDDAGTTRTALLLWDSSGGLVEIIRDGDPLAGSTIRSGRIYISGCNYLVLRAFEQSSLGGDGSLAFEFELEDGREGIATTKVVMPPAPNTEIRLCHALDPQLASAGALHEPMFSDVFADYTDGLDEVIGVAADGVATIALVYTTDLPGVADFHIESLDGLNHDIGALMDTGGAPGIELPDDSLFLSVNTQPIGNGLHAAVGLFRAPEEYVRPSAANDDELPYRGLSLTVTQGPAGSPDATTAAWIRVARPPVSLVHGIWGAPDTWDIAPGIESSGFWVHLVDYESTNAAAFSVNDDRVCAQFWTALHQYRQQTGYSAGQTIVVGHSMGGVLTRRVIGGVSGCEFRSFLNYGEGTVDRFITIATPHHGSRAARLLVLPNGTPIPILADIVELLEGCVDCGAVRDLHPESAATLSLPDTRGAGVPTHAFIGSAGDDWIEIADAFSDWIGTTSVVERIVHFIAEILLFYEDLVFGSDEHDLIVGVPSQGGGLASGDTTDFGINVPPAFGGTHIVLPDEERAMASLIDLFYRDLTDPVWATGFPPTPPPFQSLGEALPPLPFPGNGGIMVSIDGGMTSVPAGSTFGATATAFGDFVPESILLITSFGVRAADASGAAIVHVPADAAAGQFEVHAFARNAEGEIVLSSPHMLDVTLASQLLAIALEPSSIELSTGSPQQHMQVLGYYDDGMLRELDLGALGVSLHSDDASIAGVDEHGLITANGIGTTAIHATLGSQSVSASVSVTGTPGIPTPCDGDVDGNGAVLSSDIAYVVFRLGNSGAPGTVNGDANHDGQVNSVDIAFVVFRLGSTCSN